jgi:hypothetical protein
MKKWVLRLLKIGAAAFIGVGVYQTYQAGYFSMPDMPDGSYAFSFKSGMRGIVLDAVVADPSWQDTPKIFRRLAFADPERRYFGVPWDVAPWMTKAWSTCAAPTNEERAYFQESLPDEWDSHLQLARFDAVCVVEVDSKKVLRGLVYSVPKL